MRGKKVLLILLTILLTILLISSGCGEKQSASQKPQSSNTGQKPKAPSEAEDIRKDINTIISELDLKMQAQKVPMLNQTAQGESSQGQDQQSGNESQGSQNSGKAQESKKGEQNQQNQQGSQQQDQGQQQKGMNQWQKETESLRNLHRNWNMLEPQAAEAGLPDSARDGFEEALNSLTLAISGQRLEESLMSAIELYGQYGELTRVFIMPQPPEFFEVQYNVMAAMAEASRERWDNASKRLDAISDPWAMLLAQAGKQDKMLAQRVDFSLRDLKDAISSKEMNLVAVKGDIALSNLKSLEQKLAQPTSVTQ